MKTKENKFDDVVGDLGIETEKYYKPVETQRLSADKFSTFAFNIEEEKVKFLRDFVLYKRNSNPQFFHFNNSKAIREGIEILSELHPDLKIRPQEVKIPTRKGTDGLLNGVIKLKTSYWINEIEKDFIYNFIYAQSLKNNDYNKSDFMTDLIEGINSKYPNIKKATK